MIYFSQITPMLAAFLTLVLAIMSMLNRRHDRTQIVQALLMFTLCFASVLSFFSKAITDPDIYLINLRIAIFVNSSEFFMIVIFVLVLTGYIDKRNQIFLGIKLKTYLYILPPILLIAILLMQFTNIFISNIFLNAAGAIQVVFSPWMAILESVAIFFIFFIVYIMYQALRESPPGYRKTFLRNIATGIFIILLAGPLLGILVPMMGVDSGPLVDASTVVAAVIFYLSINRYQFNTINELNIDLENKVRERTRSLRQAQSQLVQSEKMASLARLVSGFAHEINNPIGAVQSASATLEKSLSKLDATINQQNDIPISKINQIIPIMQDLVTVNRKGAQRISDMVDRMKSFIQLDESELQQADIHEGLETTIELFTAKSDNQITFTKEYGNIPAITCYPAKLNQVWWQLFDNAARATHSSGEIQISTRQENNMAIIEIADNGRGIAAHDLENIFEPGFTNWNVGVGVGLGLSICYQIIQEHKGSITVASGPGQGARFTIKIPINNRG